MVLLFNCSSLNWKKLSFGGLWVLVVVLAVATFVEKSFGTDFVVRYVYHSWWFVLLWGWVAFSGSDVGHDIDGQAAAEQLFATGVR